MNKSQIVCKHCHDKFDTKGKYDAHYRSKHQKKIELNDLKVDKNCIERGEDGKFICLCGKKFEGSWSFQKHIKKCQIWMEQDLNESIDDDFIFSEFY